MSKAISYYDWELSLKNKIESDKDQKKEDYNSLGISEYNFKDFIKKWKERNLI